LKKVSHDKGMQRVKERTDHNLLYTGVKLKVVGLWMSTKSYFYCSLFIHLLGTICKCYKTFQCT